MNVEYFIAKRISKEKNNPFSRPIIRIAILAIAIGVAVMIISTSIVTGFQNEIRDKVIGFGSHIQITDFENTESIESQPILVNQDFYPSIIDRVPEVKHIQIYAVKPAIIQTDEDIQGILLKGIAKDFDWSFFKNKIIQGTPLSLPDTFKIHHLLISSVVANKLHININDTIKTYFIKDNSKPRPSPFIIQGIYETGMQEFDNKFVFSDIAIIQKLNNWGIQAQIKLEKYCIDNKYVVKAKAFGGNGNYVYNWNNNEYSKKDNLLLCITKDTCIQVVISDIDTKVPNVLQTVPDTATLILTLDTTDLSCSCKLFHIRSRVYTSGGSGKYYCGGFEILLNSYGELFKADDIVYHELINTKLDTRTIINQYPEIFSWLGMIDINVIIIIVLMIIVGIINMASALLILIIERTNMIGILKAIGTTNYRIKKIFLYNAGYLIFRGLLWGNIIGLGLCLIQKYTGILTLNQETYYLSQVPVNLNLSYILMLNIGTLVICVLSLLLPSLLVARITPTKSLKFD